MLQRLLLFLILFGFPLFADAFTLSQPGVAPTRFAPRGISIGGSADEFLIAGLLAHTPGVVPLSAAGEPKIFGARQIGVVSGSSVSVPLRVGERWIVPSSPDFLAPDRLFLSEVLSDGSLARAPIVIPWRGFAGGSAAWNGRMLLLLAGRKEGNEFLLSSRTATPDLRQIGDEVVLASGIRSFRAVGTDEGFLIVFTTAVTVSAIRVSDQGTTLGPPLQIASTTSATALDLAVGPKGAVAVWFSGSGTSWSLQAAKIDEVSRPMGELARLEGSIPRVFVRPLGDGLLLAWQGINYKGGGLEGGPILRQLLDAEVKLAGLPEAVPNLAGNEVLVGAASRGDAVLLAWEQRIVAVGTPMWGAIVTSRGISAPKALSVGYAPAKALATSTADDLTVFAAWVEALGTGEKLLVARFNRHGERLALAEVRTIQGIFGGIEIVSGGGRTLLLWHEGPAILGAYIGNNATLETDPLVVAITEADSPWRIPREPRAVWDGKRFFVAWIFGRDIAGASLSPSGVQPLGVLASPPPDTRWSTFSFSSVRIAAGSAGFLLGAQVTERFVCVGPPCGSQNFVTFLQLAPDGKLLLQPPELVAARGVPDVASDGRDFLGVWSGSDGIRARLFAAASVAVRERLLFAWPNAGPPAVTWNGTEYVAAWGYQLLDELRSAVASISPSGNPLLAVREIPGLPAHMLWIAPLPGDALVAAISSVALPGGEAMAPVGEFVRNSLELPPPPSPPTALRIVQRTSSEVEIAWAPVPGGKAYSIEIFHDSILGAEWFLATTVTAEITSIRLQVFEGYKAVRIRSLGEGGGSEPTELQLPSPSRRRGVRP